MGESKAMMAIVLAGDRGEGDPFSQKAGVPCRALIPVRGRPMIEGVLEALKEARSVRRTLVVEPPSGKLRSVLDNADCDWIAAATSPCTSVLKALETPSAEFPTLVTTADHALLRADIVEAFLKGAQAVDADLVFGVTAYEPIAERFPELKKTAYRLKGEAWCGCNLFLFRSKAALAAADFWATVERDRKKPWKVARRIGLSFLFKMLAKRLDLEGAAQAIGQRMGIQVKPFALRFPEAAIDVDSEDDWRKVDAIAERIDAQRSKDSPR